MEVVSIGAHVDHVEHTHLRPLAVVGRGQRRDPVRLHLRRESFKFGKCGRNGIALLGKQTLAVMDAPRVIVERHEVLIAIVAGARALKSIGKFGQICPHVGDVANKPLVGEIAHPIPSEPAHYIVRVLEVVGDVFLIRVVIDRIDADRHRAVSKCGNRCGHRRLGLFVGIVRTKSQVARSANWRGGGVCYSHGIAG